MRSKKNEVQLIENVLKQQQTLNDLTVDMIEQTAPKAAEPEIQTQLTKKQLADQEGALYIEPSRKLPPFGKLPDREKIAHARDWEYVKGILENFEISGEPIEFWYSKYAGDPDCLWKIPCNRPVYVPRMIAKHLEEVMKYHKFDYQLQEAPKVNDFMERFTALNTVYRAKFRAIEAFA